MEEKPGASGVSSNQDIPLNQAAGSLDKVFLFQLIPGIIRKLLDF